MLTRCRNPLVGFVSRGPWQLENVVFVYENPALVTVSGQCLPAEYREVWVSRRQRSPSMRTSSCSWRMWRRLSWRFCSGNTGRVSLIHPSRTLYIPDIVLSIMTMSEFPLEFDSLEEALESLSPLEESTLKWKYALRDWEHPNGISCYFCLRQRLKKF